MRSDCSTVALFHIGGTTGGEQKEVGMQTMGDDRKVPYHTISHYMNMRPRPPSWRRSGCPFMRLGSSLGWTKEVTEYLPKARASSCVAYLQSSMTGRSHFAQCTSQLTSGLVSDSFNYFSEVLVGLDQVSALDVDSEAPTACVALSANYM